MKDEYKKITVELTIEQMQFIIRCIQFASRESLQGVILNAFLRDLLDSNNRRKYDVYADYDNHAGNGSY